MTTRAQRTRAANGRPTHVAVIENATGRVTHRWHAHARGLVRSGDYRYAGAAIPEGQLSAEALPAWTLRPHTRTKAQLIALAREHMQVELDPSHSLAQMTGQFNAAVELRSLVPKPAIG